jgi:hypothetical protein
MAHIAQQPGSVCLEGGVSRWLVRVVGLGAELHQRPHAARGALLQFECLRKTRGVQAFGGRLLPKAWPGWLSLLHCLFPGGPGGEKPLLFTTHRPCQMCKKKKKALVSCARDQVVIARPPVLTPPSPMAHGVIGALL